MEVEIQFAYIGRAKPNPGLMTADQGSDYLAELVAEGTPFAVVVTPPPSTTT